MNRAERLVMRGRAQIERLMVDTCIIDRKTGSVLDEATGKYIDTYATVYEGPCRVQDSGLAGHQVDAGERPVELQTRTLQVPMAVTGVKVDDRVRITACKLDSDLVDRTFRIADLMHKTHATSRRLPIEEVTSG
jgi:hypothetical protein